MYGCVWISTLAAVFTSSSSSSALQIFMSFGLLNYFFPSFPLLGLLFPIFHSHASQIVPHVVLPSCCFYTKLNNQSREYFVYSIQVFVNRDMFQAAPITSSLHAIICNKLGFKEQRGTTISWSKPHEVLYRFKHIIKCLFIIWHY